MKTKGKAKARPRKPAAPARKKGKPAAKKAPARRPAKAPARPAGRARPVVAYFSRFGQTAVVAKEIARELGAEVREIRAVRPQSWVGMGFGAMLNIRYPIQPMDSDLTGAAGVVLCSPIWAGKPACQLMTFLDGAKLAGTRSALVFTTWGMDPSRAAGMADGVLKRHGSQLVGTEAVEVRSTSEDQMRARARQIAAELKQKL